MKRNRDEAERDDDAALSACARVMREHTRPSRVVDLPGRLGVKVRIVCPTEAEETEADVESRKLLTKEMGLNALELSLAQETELAKRERQIELLFLCVRSVDDVEESFFESSDEARNTLERPQREALIKAIDAFRKERFSPTTPAEQAEIVRLVRDLKELGALSTFWTSCDDDTKWTIVDALAAQPTEPS